MSNLSVSRNVCYICLICLCVCVCMCWFPFANFNYNKTINEKYKILNNRNSNIVCIFVGKSQLLRLTKHSTHNVMGSFQCNRMRLIDPYTFTQSVCSNFGWKFFWFRHKRQHHQMENNVFVLDCRSHFSFYMELRAYKVIFFCLYLFIRRFTAFDLYIRGKEKNHFYRYNLRNLFDVTVSGKTMFA